MSVVEAMGLAGGAKTLYSIVNASLSDFGQGVRCYFGKHKDGLNMEESGVPVIDADTLNIGHKHGSRSGSISSYVAAELTKWTGVGCCVQPIVDGDVRPESKQATNSRVADRRRKATDALILLKDANKLKRELKNSSDLSPAELLQKQKEIEKKLKSSNSKRASSNKAIPGDFAEALEDELMNGHGAGGRNNSGGYVASVLKAKYEADYSIVGRVLKGDSLTALTDDADIAVTCGDGHFFIKDCTGAFQIVSTDRAVLEELMSYFPEESKAELKYAEHPLFERVKSVKLRALIMVCLGCDVYLGGVNGWGPASVEKEIASLTEKLSKSEGETVDEESLYTELKKSVAKKSKLDDCTVETFVEALVYQPTNCHALGEEPAGREDHTYIGDEPVSLRRYVEEFGASSTVLIDGKSEIATCHGVGDRPHRFLENIGVEKCFGCGKTVCPACVQTEVVKSKRTRNHKRFCVECFTNEMMVSQYDDDYVDRIERMRQELKDTYAYGVEDADLIPLNEVEDIYERCVQTSMCHNDLIDEVQYPLLPTNVLAEGSTTFKRLGTIFFCEGGTFISRPSLRGYIPRVMELLASFVTYDETDRKYTDNIKDPGIFDALPANIIKFAQGSRAGKSGQRLLERCPRHAFDPKMDPLDNYSGELIELEDGTVGIILKMKVPASMRGDTYETTAAATANDLIAVECGCKSGSKKEDKNTCVHCMSVLYKLTELTHEGLGEHVMINLPPVIDSVADGWSPDDVELMRTSMIKLIEANGDAISLEDQHSMSVSQLIERFLTSTDGERAWGKLKGKSTSEPGPVAERTFASNVKMAKDLKNNVAKKKAAEDEIELAPTDKKFTAALDELNSDHDDQPNYLRSLCLIKSAGAMPEAGLDPKLQNVPVSCRLLRLRADSQNWSITGVMEAQQAADNDWAELVEEQKHRSRRQNESQLSNLTGKKRKQDAEKDEEHICPVVADKNLTKTKKRIATRYCCLPGCNVNDLKNPNTKFHVITKAPKRLTDEESEKLTKQQHLTRAGRSLLRFTLLDRAGLKSTTEGGNYRICEEHEFEFKTKSVGVNQDGRFKNAKGENKPWHQSYTLYLPKAEGMKSTMNVGTTRDSTGIATDRSMKRQLDVVNEQIERKSKVKLGEVETVDAAASDAAEARKCLQQVAEESLGGLAESQTAIKVNASVAKAAGLEHDERLNPPAKTRGRCFFNSTAKSSEKAKKITYVADQSPVIQLGMSDDDVHHRTGFRSEQSFLFAIIAVCEGKASLMRKRFTSMTWLEEWFFFAEFMYGRTIVNWWSASDKYGPGKKYLMKAFRFKLAIVRRCRERWPKYVSYEEDIALRKAKWEAKYSERNGVEKTRIIMWDMTGIDAYRFSSADNQRVTYSKYYAGNKFKGGIGTQLCGYGLTWDLWTGQVTDSVYHEDSGYLQAQEEYQKRDLVGGETVPFNNVVDKGYRVRSVNERHGNQLTTQPVFGKSEERFRGRETLFSASVAADRGGNERSVNVSKRCGIVKRGFTPSSDPKMFNDVWLCWMFWSNFMYMPVL